MSHRHLLSLDNKIIWVQGLMIDCPMGKALETCPAKDVRALPLRERLALVKQMEETQLDEIITHHRRCLRKREGA